MSDVPRSLQSWVSTIQSVVLTADVFQFFILKKSRENIYISRIRYQAPDTWYYQPSSPSLHHHDHHQLTSSSRRSLLLMVAGGGDGSCGICGGWSCWLCWWWRWTYICRCSCWMNTILLGTWFVPCTSKTVSALTRIAEHWKQSQDYYNIAQWKVRSLQQTLRKVRQLTILFRDPDTGVYWNQVNKLESVFRKYVQKPHPAGLFFIMTFLGVLLLLLI